MSHSLVLLALVGLARGYTTFKTQCTSPSVSVGFVSGADVRGTIDILWSCLFTIVACTYSVLHLNIPEQRWGRDPGQMGDIKWMVKRTWASLRYMLITMIAPELLLAKYWGDLWDAKADLVRLQQLAAEDDVPWTLTHSLLANMGGFVVKWRCGKGDRLFIGDLDVTTLEKPLQLKRARSLPGLRSRGLCYVFEPTESRFKHIAELRSFQANRQHMTEDEVQRQEYPYMHLLGPDIIELREANVIRRLPYITEEEINDKSKGNVFVRLIAMTQIRWIVVQIIVRAIRSLAVSQLEIAVLAFAICAMFMYGLSWNKPKGIQVPYKLSPPNQILPDANVCTIRERRRYNSYLGETAFSWKEPILKLLGIKRIEAYSKVVPNSFGRKDPVTWWRGEGCGLYLSLTLFGGLHVVAWNFEFPTKPEMMLWRIASVWCTGFVVIPVGVLFLAGFMENTLPNNRPEWMVALSRWVPWHTLVLVALYVSYIVARAFVLVEIFRTLFFLPPTAYIATWTSDVPHVS